MEMSLSSSAVNDRGGGTLGFISHNEPLRCVGCEDKKGDHEIY